MLGEMVNVFKKDKWLLSLMILLLFIFAGRYAGGIIPNQLIGLAICLFLLDGYYGLLVRGVGMCELSVGKAFRSVWRGVLLVSTVSACLLFLEVNTNQTIYFWDSLETWEPTVQCSKEVFANPFQALKDLRNSINYSDYNNVLPMLLALPLHIFGSEFLCYVLSIWIMFVLPTAFLVGLGVNRWLEYQKIETPSCALLMTLFLMFPVYELPILLGYANAAYLLPGTVLLMLLMNLKFEKMEFGQLFMIGMLSVLAVLQSRTAAYMVTGCYCGYVLCILFEGYRQKNFREYAGLLFRRFLYVGFFCLGFFFVFFHGFFVHVFSYDYATAYSAYKMGVPFWHRVLVPFGYSGVVLTIMLLFALTIGVLHEKYRVHSLWLFCWIVSSIILISRIQVMGWHHMYVMLLPMMIAIVANIAIFLDSTKKLGYLLVVIFGINFIQIFSGRGVFFESFNVSTQYLPEVRYDINELRSVVSKVNSMGGKSYWLISSHFYNAHMLQKIDFPHTGNSLPNSFVTHDVDLRDGFPLTFFDADIVVVGDPIQTHLRPEDQSVVSVLAGMMLSDTIISKHFRLVQVYEMSHDKIPIFESEMREKIVQMKVYQKISPFGKDDIDYVATAFETLYPDHPTLFRDRFTSYKERFQ